MTDIEFAQKQADEFGFDFCVLELANGAVIVGPCNAEDKIIMRVKPRLKTEIETVIIEYAGPFRRKHDAEFNK